MATRLEGVVWDFLGVMAYEADGVRAGAHDPNGDASGLIQFMPDELASCGWHQGPEAFRALTAEAQLPYVERYYAPHKGRLTSVAAIYVCTFLPAFLGHANEPTFVLCGAAGPLAWAYKANSGFDTAHKGTITPTDLVAAVARACVGGRWAEIVARMQDVLDREDPPGVAV